MEETNPVDEVSSECIFKTSENFNDVVSENSMNVDEIKRLIKFLKSGDIQNGLKVYSQAFDSYCSDFQNLKCLEIFIESLVDKAKEFIANNKFNIYNFFCSFCGDVLRDPITLECGHSYSKNCALFETQEGTFSCLKCGKKCSQSYLSQTKNNIFISKFIQKIWIVPDNCTTYDFEKTLDEKNDLFASFLSIIESVKVFPQSYSFKGNPSPKNFLIKGDLLVSTRNFKEAIFMYLIYSTLRSNSELVQRKAVEILHKLILKCSTTPKTCDKNLFPEFENAQFAKDKNQEALRKCPSQNSNESIEKRELCLIIEKFCQVLEKLGRKNFLRDKNGIPVLEKQDFECSLCMQLFLEPVTTSCGHTFCRRCLCRWFDLKQSCPLCKTPLTDYLSECVRGTTEMIESAIMELFSDDYAERKASCLQEMREVFNPERNSENMIPIFVCTVAFPGVSCPLHIYEPRYRLMIRQCMDSGSFKFGMCVSINNTISEYGTILEIENVSYFPDGRSVVSTVGTRRFRILRRGQRDGYNTALVQYLNDEVCEEDQDFIEIHNHLYKTAQRWFMLLPSETKSQILQHFGPMPEIEPNYVNDPNGPSWFWWILNILPVERKVQVLVLSFTSLARRLRALERIFIHLGSSIAAI